MSPAAMAAITAWLPFVGYVMWFACGFVVGRLAGHGTPLRRAVRMLARWYWRKFTGKGDLYEGVCEVTGHWWYTVDKRDMPPVGVSRIQICGLCQTMRTTQTLPAGWQIKSAGLVRADSSLAE